MFSLRIFLFSVAATTVLCAASGLSAHAEGTNSDLVKRGEYLTRMSDCQVCHTAKDGQPFAGGRPFNVKPFGTIYSPNLTPDKETGIGGWTDDQFVKAVREGVSPGWKHLYPAMVYPDYARMTPEDVKAIRAYLATLTPVHKEKPANTGVFGFGPARVTMVFWNLLNGPASSWPDDPKHSATWNRGRFIVEGPGHCQECHSPRTLTMAPSTSNAWAGNVADGWLAYNISSDKQDGLGNWSAEDLTSYLSTGHAPGHGTASGPMAEVISHSLRFLTKEDMAAAVEYIRSLPPRASAAIKAPSSTDQSSVMRGEAMFDGACAGCHLRDGEGRNTPFADLTGDHTARAPDGRNLLLLLKQGSDLETENGSVFMPHFGHGYDDQNVVDMANFVLDHVGKTKAGLTQADLKKFMEEAGE
ncbi:MAG: c-type cytochrome [Acetobacter sp.]|jgi:mono/diheme cytochrome c family protein